MAVSATATVVSYTGNGSTTSFAVTFPFQGTGSSAELEVVQRTIATGAEAVLSYTTHYTVTGGSGSTGTVVMASAPADTVQIHIRRTTTRTQTVDYTANDPFPADTHELALDRLAMGMHEIQEELDRSFKVSRTNAITTPEFVDNASTRASKLLGFTADGNTLEATTGRVNSVSASNVAVNGAGASQAATVSFTASSGALALGIPVGSTGATGPTGDTDDVLTTRGDLIKRGASTSERLAIGSSNTVLTTTGTDPAWTTVTNAMLAGSIDLTSKVTGALPVANGGSGASTHTANNVLIGAGTSAITSVAPSTSGKVLTSNGTVWTSAVVTSIRAIEFVIDGGGSAITTGVKGYLEIPFACTINAVTLLADQSGSIVVDVWKDTFANYPPVDGDSITASAVPTISSATKSQNSTLTGWTTSISAGDILGFNVDSISTCERVTISLKVTA